MASRLNPYISFKDNARQALEFYHSVFGGKLDMTTFKQGGMSTDPNEENLIMHGMIEAENGMAFMAADTPKRMEFHQPAGISISLSGSDEDELRGYFDKLAAGGSITLPLDKAPWGDTFGMLVDKFGVSWMVDVVGKK